MPHHWEMLPYRGFGPVRFDASDAAVREVLGEPDVITPPHLWRYLELSVTVGFDRAGKCDWIAAAAGPVRATADGIELAGGVNEVVHALTSRGHSVRHGADEEGDSGSTYCDDLGVYLWRDDPDEEEIDVVAAYRRGYWDNT